MADAVARALVQAEHQPSISPPAFGEDGATSPAIPKADDAAVLDLGRRREAGHQRVLKE